MNNEFKKLSQGDVTRYILESVSSGDTGSGSVASISMPMGGTRKRGDNLIAQEASKNTIPSTTPRNFVAKNAKTGGAGAHKDKKKEQKQGTVKHKKPFMEDHSTATGGWGQGSYDTYSSGNHGRGVAEEDDTEQEIGMAGSELYGIAKHAKELLALIRQHGQSQGLEAWQQSKITKAADYLNAVLQSLDYDTNGDEQGVAEAGNKPLEKSRFGTGDTRTPRDIKSQMSGASDEFVKSTADKNTGPFHSKVAKMQGKMAKSELRKREQGVAEAFPNPGSGSTGSSKEDKRIAVALRKKHIPTTPNKKKEQGVAEDDAGDVEQRFAAKMEKEKQRLAKLKQTDPEAYKREMAKRKTSSRIPPVSTFEGQGVAEGFDSAAFDRHMDKLRAQKELEKTDPMRALVNKMKSDDDYKQKSKSKPKQDSERQITDPFHPSQSVNIGEQGMAEGSTDLVQIEYWQQETMESGRWVKTKPMPRATAEKIVGSFESGEIVDIEQGVAEGLSKRDQKDVAAIQAAIERLQAQLKQPNADKAAIQQSIAHERKRLALYKQGVAEGTADQTVFSGTGSNGGKYEIIQKGPTDFIIHANGKHIDTYSSLQRAMSVLKNEVPGLKQGVAEGAPELLKKEMPTHRHAEKLLAQNGVSKDDPDYHHHLNNTIKHLRQFGNIDLINKSDEQGVAEEWSQKYKSSINCSHPKGFSQKAHCAGKKKHTESMMTMEATCPDCGMCQSHGNVMEIKKGAKDSNGFTKCWPGHHAAGTKKGKNGGQVRNCVPNEGVAEGSEDKIKQLKADHATAVHWSKNDTSPQKREAARQKAEKIKAHLEKQYKQGVAEGMDPDQRARLDHLIDTYRDATDPSDDGYGVNDHYDPDEVLDQIRREFGDNIASKVEAGTDKMHYPRQGHSQAYDRLSRKDPVDRTTKGGKMFKQDSDFRKNNIAAKFRMNGKKGPLPLPEGDAYMESLHAMLERSVSQAQHNLMVGVAHNPQFAQKVKVKQQVGQEFAQADVGKDISKLPVRVPKKK